MTSQQIDTQVRARLAEHEVRYTKGRQQVVAALAAAGGPRSATELHEDLSASIPISSLYRSLAVMADAGVLALHTGTKGMTRYELAEWLAGHHHHLVCLECGVVDDVDVSPATERTLDKVVQAAADGSGFTVLGHALEIEGRCRSCQ